jgi:hypothetical protein
LIFDSAKIPENFKTISLYRDEGIFTLKKVCSYFSKKTNNNRLEIFLTKLVLLDKLFSLNYQNYPKRVFISIFFALLGWILGLAEVYLIFYFLGFSPPS